jgi:hypothetical protein
LCYHLWIVSPLSLTEIRSMLPAGFSADVAPAPEQHALRSTLPHPQTVATLRLGGCACALQLPRTGEDERHLRRRWVALGANRDSIIAALERHRRSAPPTGTPDGWRRALAGFVSEHARNAGPTAFLLGFGKESPVAEPSAGPRVVPAAVVRSSPHAWLREGTPVLVTP